jgi:hypothetical protein
VPRFVVQHHVRPDGDAHFDLMLEAGGVLLTWQTAAAPDDLARLPAGARQIFDHPLRFLEYEGELRAGRGRCRIHDRGTFAWADDAAPTELRATDRATFRLEGKRARGRYALVRDAAGADHWRLRYLGPRGADAEADDDPEAVR